MPTMKDRERAFESKFAHDAEMQFKAEARRNKLTGLWAAEILGKAGAAGDAYALEVVASDLVEAGSEDVLRKLAADLEGKVSMDEIRQKMEELMTLARAQLLNEF